MRYCPLALMLALFGCGSSPEPLSKDAEAENIYEAVFRHQFKNNSSALQQKAQAYCLSINDKDATRVFLKRFADHKPPVLPRSEFKEGEALIFYVNNLKWVNDNTVEVSGGYEEHDLSSSWGLYRVVRQNNGWAVEKDTPLVIS